MDQSRLERASGIPSIMNRPLGTWWCLVGWAGSFLIFIGSISLLGGPSEGDASASVFTAWAIAHGDYACSYPSQGAHPIPLTAPLYPMLSGAISALLRIGHSVAFPTNSQLGAHCASALTAINQWSTEANAWPETLRIGVLSWPVLAGGAIVALRACDRGQRGWEILTVAVLAILSPVTNGIVTYFHPQDIMAVGLLLASFACAQWDRWVRAGVLLGLALATQQLAILFAVPLLIAAPTASRSRFWLATIATTVAIDLPVTIATNGRSIVPEISGTGFPAPIRDTVLGAIPYHGILLEIVSRGAPIILAGVVTYWARRHLGPKILEPLPLLSVLATAMCLRLVFELNLWGYYFIAVAVLLILLDIARGRLRSGTIAWLSLVTLAYVPVGANEFSSGEIPNLSPFRVVPIFVISIALLILIVNATRHRLPGLLIAWLLVALPAYFLSGWATDPSGHAFPMWVWQLILVPAALLLAVQPLAHSLGRGTRPSRSVPEAAN